MKAKYSAGKLEV